MSRVGALTGATATEMQRLTEVANEIGRTTELSATQAADALGFLAQAGFTVEESLEAVGSVTNAAIANLIDLAVGPLI